MSAGRRTWAPPTQPRPAPPQDVRAPFLDPFLRTFFLGLGTGMLFEGGHIALQVLQGTFPGTPNFAPLLFADHVTAL